MRPPLVRFGVAIDAPLLTALDKLVGERGCTRSEMFRDLARAEVARARVRSGVDAVAALTIVYDHHVRDLSEKLTELQHQLGDGVRSAMHVHLSHDYCLEVIVIRGKSDRLQELADRILAMRGVKHGGMEIISAADLGTTERAAAPASAQQAPHPHPHRHRHAPNGSHTHAQAQKQADRATPHPPGTRRAPRPRKSPRRRPVRS